MKVFVFFNIIKCKDYMFIYFLNINMCKDLIQCENETIIEIQMKWILCKINLIIFVFLI